MDEKELEETPVQLSSQEVEMLLDDLEEGAVLPSLENNNSPLDLSKEDENDLSEILAPALEETQKETEESSSRSLNGSPNVLRVEEELARLGAMLSEGLDSISEEELEALDIDQLLQEESISIPLEAEEPSPKISVGPQDTQEAPEQDTVQDEAKREPSAPPTEKAATPESVQIEFNEEEADLFLVELPESLMQDVIRVDDAAQDSTSSSSDVPTFDFDQDSAAEPTHKPKEASIAIIEEQDDDYDFFDEDEDLIYEEDEDERLQRHQQRRLVLIASALTLSVILGLLTYFIANRANSYHEAQAVRGITDIAAALSHARLNHRVPYNLNFKDPEFLSVEMGATLSPYYNSSSTVNEKGEFKHADYTLQIFGSSDLSRFLVIALPESGLLQNLIPKRPFLVDSESSRIYRLRDIRPWQALFKNSHSLDFVNAQDIRQQLAMEQVIQLTSLDTEEEDEAFSPPDELAQLDPAGAGLFYNAPRFHRLSKDLVEQVRLVLQDNMRSEISIQGLHERIRELSDLSHLVVYVKGAVQEAVEIQEGLRVFGVGRQFLVGAIQEDPKTTKIIHVEILSTTPYQPAALPDLQVYQQGGDAIDNEDAALDDDEDTVIDKTLLSHPLYPLFSRLAKQRRDSQEHFSSEIIQRLHHMDEENGNLNPAQQQALIQLYEETKDKQEAQVTDELNRIYNEEVAPNWQTYYPVYRALLQEFSLTELAPKHTLLTQPTLGAEEKAPLDALLESITLAQSLEELNTLVSDANALIEKESPTNSPDAFSNKNRLRTLVLRRVGDFILNPTASSFGQNLQTHNRYLIDKILHDANVSNSEERAFYLQEFDMLMKRLNDLQSHPELAKLKEKDDALHEKLEEADDLPKETRRELLEQSFQNKVALEEREQDIHLLSEKISRIPLQLPVNPGQEGQRKDIGRIGQQLLIQQKFLAPSTQRDQKLMDAIGLLVQGVDEQRSLWRDILEARRLLTESPEQAMLKVLDSPLGFTASPDSLPAKVKGTFKDLVDAQKELADQRNPEQYRVQFQLYSKRFHSRLEEAREQARRVELTSNRLKTDATLYVRRLQEFLGDYEKAKVQGLFASDRLHHSIQLHRLKRKLSEATELLGKVNTLSSSMITTSRAFQELASNEIHKIELGETVSSESVAQLRQQSHSLHYPNLAAENFDHLVHKVTDIAVNPIP